jgi:hypothetical protein
MSTRRVTAKSEDVNPPSTQTSAPTTAVFASKRASGQGLPSFQANSSAPSLGGERSELIG